MQGAPWDLMAAMYRESSSIAANESMRRAQESAVPHMKEGDQRRFWSRLRRLLIGGRGRNMVPVGKPVSLDSDDAGKDVVDSKAENTDAS